MVLLTIKLSLLCQIEGESEVTTIIIKKPGISKSGKADLVDRDIRDIAPPEIKIISPQVDTSFTAHVSASNIYLIGRLKDESDIQSLFINDEIIVTDENGFFQQLYNLADGLNVFKIDASDVLSNSFTKSLYLINDATVETNVISDQFDYKGEYFRAE